MAKFIARDYFISVNGTNLSDHCSDIEVADTADQIDLTSFGPNAYKQYGQGFHDAQITATFFSDFAASSVHSILQPLYSSGAAGSIEVRPTSAARSATNPSAIMAQGVLYGYTGIAGAVGAASTMQVTFANNGTSGIVWATA